MAYSENNSKKFVDGEVIYKESQELEDEEAFSYAIQLGFSSVLSMSLQSAIELGVFDILQKAGPGAQLSAKQIVSQLSCKNPEATSMLDRVLGLFASHDILKCSLIPLDQKLGSFQRLYSMAPVAKFFASDSDGFSLGPLIALIQDNIFLQSCDSLPVSQSDDKYEFIFRSQLKDAIREGGVPFDRVYGTHAFEYPSLDSRFNHVFNTAMINQTNIVMKKVLERYKGFEGIKRLVDVGGGLGISINLITSKYPHIQGINFDLPHVIQHSPSYPGVEHVVGDMFQSVPKGDAIFMKWILHDWSDDQCLKLLKNCYNAIPDCGKVIVVEAVLPVMPENNSTWKAVSETDVMMMTQNPGGKERSEQEFMKLAIGAGFSGIRYECYVSTFWIMEFFK